MSVPSVPPTTEESAGAEATPSRRRLIAGVAFASCTLGVSFLLARRLTNTSWPLERAHMGLVAAAVALYFSSYVFRALGWQKLFPAAGRPGRARCLTSCGAAAASGVILPFRLDYVVKVGTLRRMPGVKLGLEAIVLSIISLGLVDAVAFLPLSISATATTTSGFRLPMILVVLFGIGACGVLVAGRHLAKLPFVTSRARLSRLAERVATTPVERSVTRSWPGSSCSAAGRAARPEACCSWPLSGPGSRPAWRSWFSAWPLPLR